MSGDYDRNYSLLGQTPNRYKPERKPLTKCVDNVPGNKKDTIKVTFFSDKKRNMQIVSKNYLMVLFS